MKRLRYAGATAIAGALLLGALDTVHDTGFVSAVQAQPGGQGGASAGGGGGGSGGASGGGAGGDGGSSHASSASGGAGGASASDSSASGDGPGGDFTASVGGRPEGAGAQGAATSAAARDPNTRGLEKALGVTGTTPASESEAPKTLAEALSRWLNRGEADQEEESTVQPE